MKLLLPIQILFVGILLMGTTNTCFSQEGKAFEKGDISVNMGMSFGLIGYNYGYGSRSFPIPISANVEYGINEYIGLGGYVGYLGVRYGNTGNDTKFRSYSFGVQGIFHGSTLLNEVLGLGIEDTKVDYYAKLLLGFETYKWKYEGNPYYNFYNESNGTRAVFGPALGARYLFSPNFGAYIEGGRGAFGWITLGASLKF